MNIMKIKKVLALAEELDAIEDGNSCYLYNQNYTLTEVAPESREPGEPRLMCGCVAGLAYMLFRPNGHALAEQMVVKNEFIENVLVHAAVLLGLNESQANELFASDPDFSPRASEAARALRHLALMPERNPWKDAVKGDQQ